MKEFRVKVGQVNHGFDEVIPVLARTYHDAEQQAKEIYAMKRGLHKSDVDARAVRWDAKSVWKALLIIGALSTLAILGVKSYGSQPKDCFNVAFDNHVESMLFKGLGGLYEVDVWDRNRDGSPDTATFTVPGASRPSFYAFDFPPYLVFHTIRVQNDAGTIRKMMTAADVIFYDYQPPMACEHVELVWKVGEAYPYPITPQSLFEEGARFEKHYRT